ncbi:AAA family ATPase [Lutibacter holmesii]|uniref:AAA family ATPase n=1 Tax=Lutibacter holmesii TaxID=1137985 RepID=A0ABW3WMW4_9FLAO
MELVKLNTTPTKTVDALKLADYRIKASDPIPGNVYVAEIKNTKKFSRKNISAWKGKAKAKKTFAMTMWGSSIIAGLDLYTTFRSYKKNQLLWIDTEMSPVDAQRVAIRMEKLTGNTDNLFLYGFRPLSPAQRIEKIEEALKLHKPDVLVIDGVRDLVWNINDPVESTTVVTLIMKWSFDYDMHIAVVIHQNNEGGARGHIGTELENKAETVIGVVRDETDINISEISESFGRGKGFDPFEFFIDDDGVPVVGGVDLDNSFPVIDPEEDAPF